MKEKVKVVLGQLGSPKSPKVSDVRAFLKEFLGDPRVVDVPRLIWLPILYLFVLTLRPKKSAKAYARIWDGKSFPLVSITEKFAKAVRAHLDPNIELNHAFLLTEPRVGDVLDEWEKEDQVTRAQKVLVLPQFPQYAESTIGSVVDGVAKELAHRVNIPTVTIISDYHRAKCFISHSVEQILTALRATKVDVLVLSFHGIPLRRVTQKKDLYFKHCHETFELIRARLRPHFTGEILITFQSRFGSEVWLGPATDRVCVDLVHAGKKEIAVYCPSFVVDCLETIDEIGTELSHEVAHAGGHLTLVPCLNAQEEWARDYANFINVQVNGDLEQKENLFFDIDINEEVKVALAEQSKNEAQPLPKESKRVLKLMFLTMFLDLVGFSIIFPMFPALAKYYLTYDGDNFFLMKLFSLITSIQSLGGEVAMSGANQVVLFGGLLGALYSLLQFIAAPIWGAVSDKVGRRPVLLVSVAGLFISYVMWFFAGSFTLLIIARALGGLMSGNLSIASAVVADITDEKNRSKGMAVIGIAFAFGFILGPAIGGLSTLFSVLNFYPALGLLGVNPFSSAALVAAVLAFINLMTIIFIFPETLPKEKRGQGVVERSFNPLTLFRPLPFPGVNQANIAYFFFICSFSGMEFTLTFLAAERLGFSSMQNAYMFIFIGFIIGMVQGGFVRRKAHQVGESKMTFYGLLFLVPGLLLLAFAYSVPMLYGGLFFLATGSAMIIPCMTSMVSLYTPSTHQGKALGIFRSLGALGRVIGPLMASLIYWRYGGSSTYVVGSLLLSVPMLLVKLLPKAQVKSA